KSPSKHASFRWLGKPEPAVQKILDEQLKADPNWY
ncbi:TPA: Ivy family c-type lysozyme inhibitor, partial [Escherichia coli]